MPTLKVTLVLALVLVQAGCLRRPTGVNYIVGPECAPSAKLKNCDLADPPHCQKVALRWNKGCEKLAAK